MSTQVWNGIEINDRDFGRTEEWRCKQNCPDTNESKVSIIVVRESQIIICSGCWLIVFSIFRLLPWREKDSSPGCHHICPPADACRQSCILRGLLRFPFPIKDSWKDQKQFPCSHHYHPTLLCHWTLLQNAFTFWINKKRIRLRDQRRGQAYLVPSHRHDVCNIWSVLVSPQQGSHWHGQVKHRLLCSFPSFLTPPGT